MHLTCRGLTKEKLDKTLEEVLLIYDVKFFDLL